MSLQQVVPHQQAFHLHQASGISADIWAFLAKLVEFIELTGFPGTDFALKLSSQSLIWFEVRALSWPLQKFNVGQIYPIRNQIGCVFGIIVLLENRPLWSLKRLENPSFNHLVLDLSWKLCRYLVFNFVISFLYTTGTLLSAAAPHYDATTTMLDS